MAPKRQPSAPKNPSPPPSSTSDSEDEFEEEEEEQNATTNISTPISSQSPKKPTSKKPTSDLNQTPNPKSSSEEEDDDEEELSEDSEDEKGKASKTQPKPTQIKTKGDEEEEESDESDSDSGSDSDLPPEKAKLVKPISSKPMEGTPKSKKETVAKPSAQKRSLAPESNDKDPKKQKKADLGEEEETGVKKQLFQRIWSPEDEVSMLKAMIECGPVVSSDLTAFHDYVKESFHGDMSRRQVSEKIRRLKRKYKNLAEKPRKGGKEPTFSNGHDEMVYHLSKKIWGSDAETENNVEKRGGGTAKSSRRNAEEKVDPKSPPPSKVSHTPAKLTEKPSMPKSNELTQENHAPLNGRVGNVEVHYPYFNEYLRSGGLGEIDMRRALELMGPSRAAEWEERCMKLRSKERDVSMERITIVYEMVKQCYDLVKEE